MTIFPKPASTVVLMDERGRIYLTKRPQTMKFLGGYYVFPGGKIEKGDYSRDPNYLIGTERLISNNLPYFVAAAREVFEEVGILLAKPRNNSNYTLNNKTIKYYRNKLVRDEITFLEFLKEEDLCFSVDSLTYFGTQVTPAPSAHRYQTQFFLTSLPDGQSPAPCPYEIADAFWIYPQEALRLAEKNTIKMAEPTILALQNVINIQNRKEAGLVSN